MKRRNWMERLAQQADLQTEPIPAQPLVEIYSDRRVLIEHHKGVLQYSCETICVGMAYGCLKIEGSGLVLARMSGSQLVICGKIDGISIVRR